MSIPNYVSNSELAERISELVDRWNRRENQMIAFISQPTGTVTVTDGVGIDHVLDSFPTMQSKVNALTAPLTGAAAQAQSSSNLALQHANDAATSAADATASMTAAAASATAAATSETNAASSATAANASKTAAASSATAADASKTAAATSASNAATSATAAGTSATNAATSATNAATSANTAAAWAEGSPVGGQSAKYWANTAQAATTGTLVYMGSWDASTAYPANPNKGHFYKVSVQGTKGAITYRVGDHIIYNGSAWDQIDNAEFVTSVAGRVGAITLDAGDIVSGTFALARIPNMDASRIPSLDWSKITTGKPTTLVGYGITDAYTKAQTDAADALKFDKSGGIVTGDAQFGPSGTNGYTVAMRGAPNKPGYLAFFTQEGTRRGYIGWASNPGFIDIQSENGWNYNFNQRPLFNGYTPWDSANFDPNTKASTGDQSGTDLNNIITSGMYRLGASNANIAPGTAYGQVFVSRGSDTATQIASNFNGSVLMWRSGNAIGGGSPNWSAWRTIWHSGNQGAGSGLDADKFDGMESNQFVFGQNNTGTTTVEDLNTLQKSGFYDSSLGTNSPAGSGWTWYINHTHTGQNWGFQLASPINTQDLYLRTRIAGTFQSWNKLWHAGNLAAPSTSISNSTLVQRTPQGAIWAQDVYASRGDGSGVIFFGDSSHYLYYQGGDQYVIPNGQLSINGKYAVTSDGGDILYTRKMTQAAYNALGTKNANTLYVIVG